MARNDNKRRRIGVCILILIRRAGRVWSKVRIPGVAHLLFVLSLIWLVFCAATLFASPGRAQDGRYRMLDAGDGWDYHAVPIQIESSGAHQ